MDVHGHAGIAREFLRMCARGEVREAFARHVAGGFVHHNAHFAGDRASLIEAMEASVRAEPDKVLEVMQVVEGSDRVAVMSRLRRPATGKDYAVVHILRFQAGKVVEMWDVGREVPADSPNALGMF